MQSRVLILAGAIIGALLLSLPVFMDGGMSDGEASRLGLLLLMGSFTAHNWRKAGRPQQAAYELGIEDGAKREYRRGWRDCERSMRERPKLLLLPQRLDTEDYCPPTRATRSGHHN